MKVTTLTKKQIQRFTDQDLKIRTNVNMLAQRICELKGDLVEAKTFKLELDDIFCELEDRKKDEIMAMQRFDNELPKFTSIFYKKKLKDCSSTSQIKELLQQMSVG
jgi:hypothetical protein